VEIISKIKLGKKTLSLFRCKKAYDLELKKKSLFFYRKSSIAVGKQPKSLIVSHVILGFEKKKENLSRAPQPKRSSDGSLKLYLFWGVCFWTDGGGGDFAHFLSGRCRGRWPPTQGLKTSPSIVYVSIRKTRLCAVRRDEVFNGGGPPLAGLGFPTRGSVLIDHTR